MQSEHSTRRSPPITSAVQSTEVELISVIDALNSSLSRDLTKAHQGMERIGYFLSIDRDKTAEILTRHCASLTSGTFQVVADKLATLDPLQFGRTLFDLISDSRKLMPKTIVTLANCLTLDESNQKEELKSLREALFAELRGPAGEFYTETLVRACNNPAVMEILCKIIAGDAPPEILRFKGTVIEEFCILNKQYSEVLEVFAHSVFEAVHRLSVHSNFTRDSALRSENFIRMFNYLLNGDITDTSVRAITECMKFNINDRHALNSDLGEAYSYGHQAQAWLKRNVSDPKVKAALIASLFSNVETIKTSSFKILADNLPDPVISSDLERVVHLNYIPSDIPGDLKVPENEDLFLNRRLIASTSAAYLLTEYKK